MISSDTLSALATCWQKKEKPLLINLAPFSSLFLHYFYPCKTRSLSRALSGIGGFSVPEDLSSFSYSCSSFSSQPAELFYTVGCNHHVPQTVSFTTERRNLLSKRKAHLTLQTPLLAQCRRSITVTKPTA